MTRNVSSHIIQLVNNTTGKWLHLLSSNSSTQLLFQRSTCHFLMRHSGVIVLALLLMVGIIVLDDYGVTVDEDDQRRTAIANIDLIMGRETDHFSGDAHNRFYGVAFELPLMLAERVLGIKYESNRRSVHLSRHIITHIFFLVGGFFCYLLTYRMFNSRTLALIAMLLFLLHPRMYAHSFFNTKDIPFMSMFMIALFLTHRAFRKGDIIPFMLCGLAAGVLINLRIMGAVLLVAVLAMRVLDLYQARSNSERWHILITTAVFIVSSIWILYVITLELWSDPVRSILEWIPAIDQGAANAYQVFRGELFHSRDFHPPEYIPVWASITTPPLVLALGSIGTFAILLRYVMHPSDTLRNATFRFGLVLIACVAVPVAAAVYLDANIYNGWRQMYFLYAPFCLLAVFGLNWLVLCIENQRLRTGVYATTGATIAITVIAMAGMHPHQHVYFNFLVDRITPEHLRTQYDMEYWGSSFREALEYMLGRYPDAKLHIWATAAGIAGLNQEIMPEKDRQRISIDGGNYDFYITNYRDFWGSGDFQEPSDSGIYTRTIYNNTLFTILPVKPSRVQAIKTPDSQEIEQAYKSAISKPPVWLSDFNLHLDGNAIIYIKSPCKAEDTTERFFLYIFPTDSDDLPQHRQRMGFDNLDFDFENRGGMLDDKCAARVYLPEYDIAAIETGQLTPDKYRVWGARIPVAEHASQPPEQ